MAPWETHHLVLTITSTALLTYTITRLLQQQTPQSPKETPNQSQPHKTNPSQPYAPPLTTTLAETVGHTPLVLLPRLSTLTHCQIYAKLELLNPGGSPKDRVAASILSQLPDLRPGDTLYEGTVGSTGISLATLCRSLNVHAHIIMPSDQSVEKSDLLRKLGAKVTRVPPAPIVDQEHFVNVARTLAGRHTRAFELGEKELVLPGGEVMCVQGRGWFADQFENEANWRTHFDGTGPEIVRQMDGVGGVDAFVAGAGTGGTVAGVGLALKMHAEAERPRRDVRVVLADPQGSGLYNKVKLGVFWSEFEREGTRRRSQVDSVIEGIGLVRSTRNWEVGWENGVVDDAVKVTDGQARNMARWLVEQEGWFVGGSSAVNCKLPFLFANVPRLEVSARLVSWLFPLVSWIDTKAPLYV
jgi:cysteine synthase